MSLGPDTEDGAHPAEKETAREDDKATKSTRMSWKEWVSIILSPLAFVVSLIGLYYSTLRQADEIAILVTELPGVLADREEIWINEDDPRVRLVFVNSGTRPAAILSLKLAFMQGNIDHCKGLEWMHPVFWLKSNFDVLVVEEKKVLPHTFKLERYLNINTNAAGFLSFERLKPRPESNTPLLVCLAVELATPASASNVAEVLVQRVAVHPDGGMSAEERDGRVVSPITLVKRTETIFWPSR